MTTARERLCSIGVLGTAAVLCGVASSASAIDWQEPRNDDAGELTAIAQIPTGIGTLNSISGTLEGSFLLGRPDFQDVFKIFISNPSAFTATSIVPFVGFNDFDTQLWLFDELSFGVLGNDNIATFDTHGRLLPSSNDGSGAVVTTPGIYYLAVSGFGSVPTSGGAGIFGFSVPLEISGPDGPGGAGAHDGWSADGATGNYTIILTGTTTVPAPGAAMAIGAGLGFLAVRRRRWHR